MDKSQWRVSGVQSNNRYYLESCEKGGDKKENSSPPFQAQQGHLPCQPPHRGTDEGGIRLGSILGHGGNLCAPERQGRGQCAFAGSRYREAGNEEGNSSQAKEVREVPGTKPLFQHILFQVGESGKSIPFSWKTKTERQPLLGRFAAGLFPRVSLYRNRERSTVHPLMLPPSGL